MKDNKKCQKGRWKFKVVFLFWTRPTYEWCSKDGEMWSDIILSIEGLRRAKALLILS